jgi:4-amino-4-deoxy-L-arabinose transferase-like glycosyltransferase
MRRSDLFILFGLALALRSAYLLDLRETIAFTSPLVDAFTYDQAARAIAASGLGSLETPFYQPPLYSIALGGLYAVTGGSYWAPRVAQMLFGALTVLLVAMIAARFAGRRAGWAAGALFAAYGPVLYFEGELLPTALLLGLHTGALALLARTNDEAGEVRRVIGAGLLLGLATAARPTGLLLVGGVALWWLRHRTSGRPARAVAPLAAFVGAALIPVLPFTIANYASSREPILVSWNGGLNFYLGNGARSDSLTAIQPGHHWDKLQIAPFRDGVRASRRAESNYWTSRALREMAADPAAWVASTGRKVIRLLRARETPRNTDFEDFRRDSRVLALPLPGFGLVLPLACIGWLLGFPSGAASRRIRVLLGLVLAAVTMQNLLFFVADRYRLEAVPVLCILAGLGVDAAIRRRGRLGGRALAACAAVVVVNQTDLLREGAIDETRAAIHRAVALQRAGWNESAARKLAEALRHDPNDVDALRLLGEHFAREGEPARALASLDLALAGAPDYLDALLLKARLLERLGRGDESDAIYRAALAADPFSARARLQYGAYLAAARRWDEARAQFDAGLRIDPANADLRENLRNLERAIGRIGS